MGDLVSYRSLISYTQLKIDLFSAARQSCLQNSFNTLLLFFGGPGLSISEIKTEENTLWVKPTPLWVSF